MTNPDAVVVGSGPNGLAAAITLARAGLRVLVVEAHGAVGGGMRTAERTLPGYHHDVCSAVHPLALSSPFFRSVPLEGVAWLNSPAALAHPFPDGAVALLERDLGETERRLGGDGPTYRRLVEPFVRRWDDLAPMILDPLAWPTHPVLMARFGLQALRSATHVAARFRTREARGLFAGIAAHAMVPLEAPATASFGLVLATAAHAVGWPLARGGSQRLADALVAHLVSLGGAVETEHHVRSLHELPSARAYLLSVPPRVLVELAGERLPRRYTDALLRFRHGPGSFKMDFALDGPIPWRNPECLRAATVHLGGPFEDIARAERAVHDGNVPAPPFVLLVQPSVADTSRAPEGHHVVWAYCHVPHGSGAPMEGAIVEQIERFAPGFRDRILAQSALSPEGLEAYNPSYLGGDINGGAADLRQLFTRPVASLDPYATPARDLFLCSSSTPPGGGVHGMCGMLAARSALRKVFGLAQP